MKGNRKFSVVLLALVMVFASIFNVSFAAKATEIQQVNVHVGKTQENSRNITWITKDQKDSTIVVKDSAGKEVFKDTLKGEKRENINSTVNPETNKNDKEVIYSYQSEVNGLKPNESYTYEISNEDSKFEGSFKVSKAKKEAGKIRFAMIADPQVSVDSKPDDGKYHPYISQSHGSNFYYINEYAKENPLDFLYIAGDHTDKGTNEDHWRVFYSNDGDFKTAPQDFLKNNTIVSTVGNHDSNDFAGHINAPDLGKGTYEESVYSSDFGNVKFIVLNNANKKMPDGEIITEEYLKNDKGFQNMVEFLRKEVKDAKDNGMWTIVGFHKPLYTGASHMKDDDMRSYRKLLNPIFTELDVDMVLAGHDHVYTRAFIDKDGKNTTTKVKEINGKPVYKNIENSVFHLVGEHGAGLKWYDAVLDYKTPEGDPLLPRYEFADKNSAQEEPPSGETRQQTFVVVEIEGDTAHFTTYKSKYKNDPYFKEHQDVVKQFKDKTGLDLEAGFGPYIYDEFYITREKDAKEDLNSHWANSVINKVLEKGYMENIDGSFNPDKDATRIEFVKAVAKLAKVNPDDYKSKSVFKDVATGTTDAGYINWAYEKGITKGVGEDKFDGNRTITRQEIATILNRYTNEMNIKLDKKEVEKFADDEKIADWAKADVLEARAKGIFSGKDNNMFDPMANITRAEVAQVIVNMDK